LFRRLTIASSSGHIRLFFVDNDTAVYSVITELLEERQLLSIAAARAIAKEK
jgi:hypothetical protein